MVDEDMKDILVKVYLTAEEFVSMRNIADELGLAQSAYVRKLIKAEIRAHALGELQQQADSRVRAGLERG